MIIGSVCMKHHFENFKRIPKDVDAVVYNEDERKGFKKALSLNKFEIPYSYDVLINPVLIDWCKKVYVNVPEYCPKDELFTLKVSHCFWNLPNNSWERHMFDIHFLKENGCNFIPELFWELFEYWNKVHGKRKESDLDMSAEQFFNNAIKYEHKHDDIHEMLIQHSYFKEKVPTYKKILKEGAEVDVCMKKFEALSEIDKFNVVFEEVAVMSIENRFPKDMFWKEKYQRMLKKFIIEHCKVEEGIWIILHHKELMTKIPFNYQSFLQNFNK